jgi:uncharacterized membrane protein YgaE (UPF0421/DUF939 family)
MRGRLSQLTLARRPGLLARGAARRLRPRLWLIVQTAAAAVAAWYLAVLLLPTEQPYFAPIATVIALGATLGQRGARAAELVAGVVLGLAVADVIVHLIGTGPLQIGVLIVLAMAAAVVMGGRELLVNEAAISAILLAAVAPSDGALPPDRVLEALIGGGVALAVHSLLFPPDPALLVGRAAQAVFAQHGRALEEIAGALQDGDAARAEAALHAARGIDGRLHALEDALGAGLETARMAPPRRATRERVQSYSRSVDQIDFAVRNTRVLARHVLRATRASGSRAPELCPAVRQLAEAVWALAAQYDEPQRADEVRRPAVCAAATATAFAEREHDLALIEVASQVRSTAVDLVRASDLVAGPHDAGEPPTDELLAA